MMDSVASLRTTGRQRQKSAVRNNPEMVFEAAGGHLFLKGDANRTQDQHLGILQMPPEQVDQWRSLMIHRAEWMREAGIEFAFMIGPDKQSVYWPRIHGSIPDHRNSLKVFNGLDQVRWVDPVHALSSACDSPPVYPFNDSHYDAWGAYIAYRELFDAIPSLRDNLLSIGVHFTLRTVEGAGDLGNKLLPYRLGPHARIERVRMTSRPVYNNGVSSNGGFRVHFNPNGSEGVGVLCGDSYSQNIYPFIAEHFRVLVHLRSPIDEGLIRALTPSIVIGTLAERFMLQPPVLPDDVPSELMFIRKLANGEIKREVLAKARLPLQKLDLPEPVLAAISRHEALAAMLLGQDVVPDALARFSNDIFDGAAAADVVVAAYIAWAQGRVLEPGWQSAYGYLPAGVRAIFEMTCPT